MGVVVEAMREHMEIVEPNTQNENAGSAAQNLAEITRKAKHTAKAVKFSSD